MRITEGMTNRVVLGDLGKSKASLTQLQREISSGKRITRPSDDPFGSLNLVGGLRRSMAKAGYCDLKEFQKVGLTVGG